MRVNPYSLTYMQVVKGQAGRAAQVYAIAASALLAALLLLAILVLAC